MFELLTFKSPYLGIYTKSFLLQTQDNNVFIDSGLRGTSERLLPHLENGRSNVLLMTHGHWDHIGGNSLIKACGGTIYAGAGDARLLTDLDWHWNLLFGQFEKDFTLPPERKNVFWASVDAPAGMDQKVVDGETLDFGDVKLRVIALPGHSAGSVCYLEENSGMLFTGDGLMGNGFFSGTPQIEDFERYLVSMERLEGMVVSQVFTNHTDSVNGTDLTQLTQEGKDCARRLLQVAQDYVHLTQGELTVGALARHMADAEHKKAGGGTCVSALAALWYLRENHRAAECVAHYKRQ